MKNEIKYELPIYSSSLEEDPVIISENMDMKMNLIGLDDNNELKKVMICFKTVVYHKFTSTRFSPKLYNSYDRIV